MNQHRLSMMAFGAVMALGGLSASAQEITIKVENLQAQGGFSFTPFWVAVHNGGFDSYDGGATLAGFPGTEELAELGQTGPISDAFAASAAGLAGGVDGTVLSPSTTPPVFTPGDSGSLTLNVGDATTNRYFSYASMVIPSNDLFVANGNPFGIELFDALGNFNGPVEILIFGRDVNDAGTEANDAGNGPAFVAGQDWAAGSITDVAIINAFDDPTLPAHLTSFISTSNPIYTVQSTFGASDLIARITIVPEPASAGLLGLLGLGLIRRRTA
ncbi:MAG: spondin domain-containing protein [Phycisphaeraceae bacterium]